MLHVNHLKSWHNPKETVPTVAWSKVQPTPLSEGDLPWQAPATNNEWLEELPVDPGLTITQQHHLHQLLAQYGALFSSTLGRTSAVWHIIETPPGHVVHTSHCPTPWKWWKTVNKEVSDMLRMNVIEPSTNEWRNPIVLLPKPNGTVRFCIDFRKVNKIAIFDAYPMLCTNVLLSQLGEATYLSALDLTNSYWQIPLHGQDKKTAFTMPKLHPNECLYSTIEREPLAINGP